MLEIFEGCGAVGAPHPSKSPTSQQTLPLAPTSKRLEDPQNVSTSRDLPQTFRRRGARGRFDGARWAFWVNPAWQKTGAWQGVCFPFFTDVETFLLHSRTFRRSAKFRTFPRREYAETFRRGAIWRNAETFAISADNYVKMPRRGNVRTDVETFGWKLSTFRRVARLFFGENVSSDRDLAQNVSTSKKRFHGE